VSSNYTVIYAGLAAFFSYSLIQMVVGVSNLQYGNLSIYEREYWQLVVALTVFNIFISIYVIIRTWRINK
ncbi:MAG TPA: hypothetical protein PL168_11195, partial [Methanobacterium sp.]|nr:hypothetical protein [Methanobacterium sp.]